MSEKVARYIIIQEEGVREVEQREFDSIRGSIRGRIDEKGFLGTLENKGKPKKVEGVVFRDAQQAQQFLAENRHRLRAV